MIYEVRGVKVMLDSLRFQIGISSLLENQEITNLKYQNGTSSRIATSLLTY